MKKSYNKAFTLVELLAVIVILAIILVIAVPKIMDVINSSKKSTLETSVKMIASSAEKTKLQNKLLGKEDEEITCSSVAKLSSNDYGNCKITFDGNTAKVTVKGKGKFEGLNVCNGTKSNATVQTGECATATKYFSYEPLDEEQFIPYVEVKDVSKCTAYLNEKNPNTESCPTCEDENVQICNGTLDGYIIGDAIIQGILPSTDYEKAGLDVKWRKLIVEDVSKCTAYLNEINPNTDDCPTCEEINVQLCNGTLDGYTIGDAISDGIILSSDFEEAGLKVVSDCLPAIITGYNTEGGLDVVIPSEIDGYCVVEIQEHAMDNDNLISVQIPNTVNKVGYCAFGDESKLKKHNLPSSYTCNYSTTASMLISKGELQKITATSEFTTYHAGYRYIGENPNNYVYYNCDDDNDVSTCEKWRIIGVFDVDNGNGVIESRIKIINAASTFSASWDSSGSDENNGHGINQWGPSTKTDGTPYEGSDLYRLLNGFYIGESDTCTYCNGENQETCSITCTKDSLTNANMKPLTNSAKNLISTAKWNTYGVSNGVQGDTYGISDIDTTYLQENGIIAQYTCTNCNDTINRTTSTNALVGLMSASDIWYSDRWERNEYKGYWHGRVYPISITPAITNYNTNQVWAYVPAVVMPKRIYWESDVIPSVYLKSNVIITGNGDGTIDNPYRLAIGS